ncbi:MAG: hypothetical protein JRF02_06885 [Deltaproteobacteria bacterium]|jgi:hypothetical protein|nr:hypothetical protein [Deltaproteobacteria bacterium]
MTEKHYSDLEKLQVLLTHWLQHNESHGEEYLKWAETARKGGYAATAEFIEQAVDLLQQADESLQKALESVGGPSRGHHHHHHHHD